MAIPDQPVGASSAPDHQFALGAALAERYRVERELGAGGMATVYLAEDVKHHRKVAIKVLHAELSAILGPERFLKEIELTANLQHPHILPLFDSGNADGLLYYVMPYVEGETLRARLTRDKQLSIADAIRIASEAADALAYAHGRGIVHRDIKPENILLQNGHALVADFGIALAVEQAGGVRMTQTGLSLGTPQYMSPEQAMGEREVGPRSDIYSLGAVTYELLVGEPPFTGPNAQAIVAQVLTSEPRPLTVQRKSIPPHVDDAVMTALEKLPADRFSSAAEFASVLAGQADAPAPSRRRGHTGGQTRMPTRPRMRDPLLLAVTAIALCLAATVVFLARRAALADDPFPVHTAIVGDSVVPLGPAALSPDGHTVVYVARPPSGSGQALYLRHLDQLTSRLIPGTDGAGAPVFSPDGTWLAFVAHRRKVVKLALDGGTPIPLADVPDDGGIDWSPRGDIVLGGGVAEGLDGLLQVNAAGGAIMPLTHVDRSRHELSHALPCVLADGRTVLFTIWYGSAEQSEVAATSLDNGKVVPLGILGTHTLGVVGGRLVYIRADGTVMAIPFDVAHLRSSGVATPVQDSIPVQGGLGSSLAFLTRAGGLVFARGGPRGRLVWVDHAGHVTPALNEVRAFQFVRLSPDGRQAALMIGDGGTGSIWIFDTTSGTLTPLTTGSTGRNPSWSPDGRRLLYVATRGGRAAFWWQPADGSGPAVKAGEARHNPWFTDLSPDGRTTVFNAIYDGTFNLESFSLDSAHEERDIAASPTATEGRGRFSPDGRFVAYMSDESGRPEVYVRPFPEAGGRLQISTGGGARPIWAPDGKRIYFWQGSQLMAASLVRDPALRVVSRAALFDGQFGEDFDVSKDGTRFLMIESQPSGRTLVAVPNWPTELRRLTGGSGR